MQLSPLRAALARVPWQIHATFIALIAALLLISYVSATAHRIAELRQQVQVAEANRVAAEDSTRIVGERWTARLAQQREMSAAEIEALRQENADLDAHLRRTKRQLAGVTHSVITHPEIAAETTAPVVLDSADVREAHFTADTPDGSLTAHVRLAPDSGWARLTAQLGDCTLIDAIATDRARTTAELLRRADGPCASTFTSSPILPAAAVQPRPPLLRDPRFHAGVAVGSALTFGLFLFASR